MSVALQYYALNRGLDSIDYASNNEVDKLPAGMPTLLPPGAQVNTQLSQVLPAPALNAFLEEAFSPSVRNQALLSPRGFRTALRHSVDELSAMLKASRASGTGGAVNTGAPDTATTDSVRAALGVMRGAADLQAALAAYQGLLIAG